jgi:hypothetical protein
VSVFISALNTAQTVPVPDDMTGGLSWLPSIDAVNRTCASDLVKDPAAMPIKRKMAKNFMATSWGLWLY